MHIMSLHRFRSWDLQVTALHPCSGRFLASPSVPPLSAVQGATGHPAVHTHKVYGHAQHTFLQFSHCYGLLPASADQETLLCLVTFLADAKGLQRGTILGYQYGVRVLHINMGLSDPLKGALWLHKDLWAIISSQTQHLASWLSHMNCWYSPISHINSLHSESCGLP